jgi:D-methionine transport system substrate-binding protein
VKRILANHILTLLCLASLLLGCHKPNPNTLIIGTIAGPETALVEAAQKIAQDNYGLTIKIIEFNDYNLPNEALEEGSLDANVYQHLPYLQSANDAHGYHLMPIGKTFIYPAGIYSSHHKKLQQIHDHAVIAIPNDPSNEARALLLLKQAGFIQFNNHPNATPKDITANPKQLQFKELDAAQLTRALVDVDAAVINTNYAIPAGFSPLKDALYLENTHSPYGNLIVARTDSSKMEQLNLFVKAFQSSAVKTKAKAIFGENAIALW